MSLLDRRSFLTGSAKAAGALMVAGTGSALAAGTTTPYVCGIALFGGDVPPINLSGTVSGNKTYTGGFLVPAGTTLTFDPNVSTTVTVSANVVVEGTLKMRPANKNVIHKLVFTDVDESAYVGGGTVPLATDVGLWVVEAGKLDAVGTEKVAWNRTGWDSSWDASDEVRIAPTAFGDTGSGGFATYSQGQNVPQIDLGYALPASATFTDTFDSVHKDNIEALAASGITQGCEDGLFCPRDLVTRGQMAAFLNRALNLPAAGSAGFVDTVGNTFEDDINRLAAAGITQGCDPTHFCPNDPVTRAQMAAFLVRALGYPPAASYGFTDTVGHHFEDEIDRLAAQGVTLGCTPTTFCPNEYVTREQMASFLARAFNLPIPEVSATSVIGAEVLNLTRNVKIEGTPGGNAHVFIRSSEISTIENVEIRHMGPRQNGEGVLGRYGLHFHANFDDTRGTVVRNTVIAECTFHAFVPHLSNGISFYNCISYDTMDDAYWWDKPLDNTQTADPSDDVLYNRCVAAYTHRANLGLGHRLAGFFLGKGVGSVAVGCVAVGVQNGGIGYIWPEKSHGIWGFTDCVAHNNNGAGLFVWQNNPDDHLISGFVAYRNNNTGIEHGAYVNRFRYSNCLLVDNGDSAILLHAGSKVGPDVLDFRGITAHGKDPISTTVHSLPPNDYTVFTNCNIVPTSGSAVYLGGGGHEDRLRFVDCDFNGGAITFDSAVASDSIVQVVENGVTTTYTP